MLRGRRNARFTTPPSEPSCGANILTSSRIVIVAGAGIGGLTAALALARNGFRVVVLEQTERLEETGAGIQLSPNAARTLIDLGLEERLRPHVVAPAGLRVLDARSGREIVRMPLGEAAAQRYGAPYWAIHRGDLQAALAGAVAQKLDITVKLGMHMDDFVVHRNGVTVSAHGRTGIADERGIALIAADGLWSATRARLGYGEPPRFAGRTAWRALVRAKDVSPRVRRAADPTLARPRCASRALSGQGRQPHQRRRHHGRQLERAGLERAGCRALTCCRAFPRATGRHRRSRCSARPRPG